MGHVLVLASVALIGGCSGDNAGSNNQTHSGSAGGSGGTAAAGGASGGTSEGGTGGTGTGAVGGAATGGTGATGGGGTGGLGGTGGAVQLHPNEPGGFMEITQRPFDAANEDGWSDDSSNPNWKLELDPSAPYSPPGVLTILYPAGFVAGSSPANSYYEGAFAPKAKPNVYLSFFMKHSSNWQGHSSGVNKILFIGDTTCGSGAGAQVYFSAQGAGADPLYFQVRTQGPVNHDLGANVAPLADSEIVRGKWQRVEVVLRANSSGVANGEVQVWIDGVKTHEYKSEELLESDCIGRFNRIVLGATWGGIGKPDVINDMTRSYDHFYLSGSG